MSKIASDILIFDEKYSLHDWEKRNIYVKKIGSELSQLVNETLLNMRRYLIDERIKKLQKINIDKNKTLKATLKGPCTHVNVYKGLQSSTMVYNCPQSFTTICKRR